MLSRIDIGIMVPPDKLLVEAWLDSWIAHLELVVGRPRSTVHRYRTALWTNALPIMGELRMQRMTPTDVDRIYRDMAQGGGHHGLSALSTRSCERRLPTPSTPT